MDPKQKLAGLIDQLISQGASDLHLGEGTQPVIRVSGALTPMLSEKVLSKEDMQGLINELLSPSHKIRFQ
jgi:Tfp pilus assembly pilus retraction ATPase PilT